MVIDERKRELDSLTPISPPVIENVKQKQRIDWNFHSNRLEGNRLDYGETIALLLHNVAAGGKPLLDYKHVEGHNKAILAIEEMANL